MTEQSQTLYRFNSIATQQIIVLLTVVLLVAGMVGTVSYNIINQHLMEERPHQLSTPVRIIVHNTETLLEVLNKQLRRIAEDPAVQSYRKNNNPIVLERFFQRFSDIFPHLGYINKAGHEEIRVTENQFLDSIIDVSETSLYQGARQTPNTVFVGPVSSNTVALKDPLLELAYTHQDYFDQMHGTIVAGIPLSHIAQAVNSAYLEEQWFALIVDASGRIVYSPRVVDLGRELNSITDTTALLATSREGGVVDGWHHVLDTDCKVAIKEITELGWKVLVAAPREVLDAPLIQMRNQTFIAFALVLILALGVAMLAGRRITLPIINLTRAVSEISEDADLSRQVDTSRQDEIGELARGFNRMLERLQHARQDIADALLLSNNILTQMVDPLILVSPQGQITRVNPAAIRLLGEQQLLGQSLRKLFPNPECFASLSSNEQGKISGLETLVYADDGRQIPVLMSASIMESPDINLQGTIIQVRDITEHRRAEQERQSMEVQLRHAQKLEAVGQLAAGIAHEINTPTQFVSDNTRFLQDAFADYGNLFLAYERLTDACAGVTVSQPLVNEVTTLAEEIDIDYLKQEIPLSIEQSLEGLRRIARIVRAMKEFSHPGTEEKTPTDLNRAIQTTIDVSRNEWKYSAELITELDSALPQVPVLPGEFNQVILNMIVNAAHSITDAEGSSGKKGEIRITTRQDGDWAEIRVSDSGKGIPEAIRKRIFDPFFTTKEVGKGSGQGLAISWSVIVDKHSGSIDVESEEGKGSSFIIRLPLEAVTPEGKQHDE